MTMDPNLMGGMAGQPSGSVEDEFVKGFSDMAYAALQKQAPDLVKEVITFRVLDTKPDIGMGVGCFILNHGGEVFFVPTVVSDNQIKPLDLFYSRRLDRYYPLVPEWLNEASKSSVSEMGAGVKAPPTLQTDVDIRNLIVPPTTGRYSYASEGNPVDGACWAAFEAVAEKKAAPALQLIDVLAASPNAVKVAYARTLKKRKGLLAKAAGFYGAEALAAALQPRAEKTAEIRREWKARHDVFVADQAMPLQALKENLDPMEVGNAFSNQRLYGFYVKDKRKAVGRDVLQFVESDLNLVEPQESGKYKVWMSNGDTHDALVLVRPVEVDSWHVSSVPLSRHRSFTHDPKRSFVVILPDGRCATLDRLVASPILHASQGELDAQIKKLATTPKVDDYGVFVSSGAMDLRALTPVRIKKATSSAVDAVFETDMGMAIRIDSRQSPPNGIVKPNGGNTISLGRGWRFVPCKDPYPPFKPGENTDKRWEERERARLEPQDFCRSSEEILRAVERELLSAGAKPMEVKMGSDRRLYVGDKTPLTLAAALTKVAEGYDVSVKSAADAIGHVVARKPGRLWAVPRAKAAADDKGGGDAGADPNAAPMDPNAMAMAQQPPPPSGLDLAIAEQLQQIQMQIQALNDKATALQTVQQRAMQIDSGGGAAAAPMGAASMMGGPAPAQPGMPPQDPNAQAMGGQAPAPAQPGMDPNAQAMGGQAPAQQGAMPAQPGMPAPGQPGMDPAMAGQQQGPMPTMTNEALSAGDVESSINPAFLDQAASLDQAHVFDAASVASLAKQKNLRGAMLSYAANLEKSLDNLGRMLLLLNLQEADLKESIGNDAYVATEEAVRDTFKGLGDAILSVNQLTDQSGSPSRPRMV